MTPNEATKEDNAFRCKIKFRMKAKRDRKYPDLKN